MRICTTCGTTNSNGARSCKKCGSAIETVNIVVKTHYRRNRKNNQKQSNPQDFNPVQNFQQALSQKNNQEPPLHSTTPISNLEYKFHSTSTNNGTHPLKSIPPTPVDELKIPHPIRPREKTASQKMSPIGEHSKPIQLSDNIIKNDDLKAIPQNFSFDQPKAKKPSIVRTQPSIPNTKPTRQENANPMMVFSNQSLQSQQIENEMTNVMSVLQGSPGKSTPKKKLEPEYTKTETEIPHSLTDILENLSQLDLNIEASALVNIDGKIIASAISERIDKFLISTITNTLGNISQDVIASLESGDLKFISIYATKGILFLSPIMKNIFLVLYTGSDAKIGLINLAKMVVKKKIELFYAKRNLQKSPV